MITQAEITEFAKAKKASTEASKDLEALKKALVERKDEAQEDGPHKLKIDVRPNETPAYKKALESFANKIRELRAVYTNGGGKPHLLNDKLDALVATATKEAIEPGKTTTTVSVEANV
jgi:hypothetical protein